MSMNEIASGNEQPAEAQQSISAMSATTTHQQQTKNYLEFMHQLLRVMKKENASDLFITVGSAPSIKVNGNIQKIANLSPLTPEQTAYLTAATMTPKQQREFLNTNECNYAISLENVGRFRVNAFKQRSSVGLVIRIINTEIPALEELKMPNKLKDLVMEKNGLVIVVGATGSGKSNTLAGMIGYRNQHQAGHILTIEDPIEFIHKHDKSIITQREVGVDTDTFEIALKNALRQAPNVIMIGEVRDRETMEYAINFAETGHLCVTTLHANNANQALERILNFFPEERKQQLLMDLSFNLKGIISQRLIPATKGGRYAAVEILLNSPRITDLIKNGEIDQIKEVMKNSRQVGMQTFDQALFDLYEAGIVSYDDAVRNSDAPNDLKLEIRLNSKRSNHTHGTSEKLILQDL